MTLSKIMYHSQINLYRDIFYPPKGFTIAHAELVTWSLAKDMLRLIPAMILAVNKSELVSGTLKNPNRYIKDNQEELPFHIFYDGKNKREYEEPSYFRTQNGNYAMYIFHKYCTPVEVKGGLFHPKIILIQFRNHEGKSFFRVCISSKNLTWSNYIEAGVILESSNEKEDFHQAGQALSDFFREYYGEEVLKKNEKVSAMLTELGNTCLRVKGCSAVPEIFFGKNTNFQQMLNTAAENYDHLRICSMNPTAGLINSNPECKVQYLCNFKDMYKDKNNSGTWTKKEECKDNYFYLAPYKNKKYPKALHIKSYTFWNDNDDTILTFIGSANCSNAALNGINEEVLVKFTAEKSSQGWFYSDPSDGVAKFSDQIYCGYKTLPEDGNVEIEDCDEETVFSFKVEIENAEYQSNSISFQITNKEDVPLTVSLATLDSGVTVPEKSNQIIIFKDITKNNFTDLILITDGNQNCSYRLALKSPEGISCGWHGKAYEELKKALPEDEIRSIDDLIPEPEGVHFDEKDKAFEKITKCKMLLSDEDFIKFVKDSLHAINAKKEAAEKLSNDDTIDDMLVWLNYLFKTYSKETDNLIKYLEKIKETSEK